MDLDRYYSMFATFFALQTKEMDQGGENTTNDRYDKKSLAGEKCCLVILFK